MITAAMSRRAQELAAEGAAFVVATVVRAQRPTSVEAGNVALVLGDGTIEGFVGGVCTEHSVRAYSLQAIESGESVLLRILPFSDDGEPGGDATAADGAVTVQNPCLSGGAIEVFLEPVVPAPRVLVVGETPIADAVLRLGSELGWNVVGVDGEDLEPRPADLALVVAAHGRDELQTLRRGLESGVAYVGLVASRKRGDGVLAELRSDGVPDDLTARIDVPAGLDIGARTPAEVALSILASIVAVHRDGHGHAHHAPTPVSTGVATAVDPVCGMTVAAVPSTPSLRVNDETVYFCCDGCKSKFETQHEHARATG
jgi:xanthine dehydrogenase accessory factor